MNFAEWMHAHGWTQATLAGAVDCARQSIHQWLKGEHAPGHEALQRLQALPGGGELTLESFPKKRKRPGRPRLSRD